MRLTAELWECAAVLPDDHPAAGDVCGLRYLNGPVAPRVAGDDCSCGERALLDCTTCGTPLCGMHVRMFQDRVVCQQHEIQRHRDLARREALAVASTYETGLRRAATAAASADDVIERFVRLHAGSPSGRLPGHFTNGQRSVAREAMDATLRSVSSSLFGSAPAGLLDITGPEPGAWYVDNLAFTNWVFSHRNRGPVTVVRLLRRGSLPLSTVSIPLGWRSGVLVDADRGLDGLPWPPAHRIHRYLLRDGRVVETRSQAPRVLFGRQPGRPANHFVRQVARLLDIPVTTAAAPATVRAWSREPAGSGRTSTRSA